MTVQLYLGDCLEVMKSMPDKSVDAVITDPPYNIGKADWDKIGDYINWCGRWIIECQRVLKDSGSFYFFHNDIEQVSDLILWIRNNTAFVFKSFIVIDKTDNSYIIDLYKSQNHFRNYLNLAEYCLFYTFQDKTGLSMIHADKDCFYSIKKYLDDELDKSGYTEQSIKTVLNNDMSSHYFGFSKREKSQFCLPTKEQYAKLQAIGYFSRCYEDLRAEYEDLRAEYEDLRAEYEDLRYTFNKKDGIKNVWRYSFSEDKKYKHPTQKPTKLIRDIAQYSTNEGMTILDPFMGSGTTGVACVQTGRNFIGIEIDEGYFKIAERRIAEAQMQPRLV